MGELVLDIADPVVVATVAGVPLRLRVELDQKDVVELNPAAAARLPIAFGPGFVAEVGRVALAGTGASAEVRFAGRPIRAELAAHGRDCCLGADGSVGPALLPYARIRFVRPSAAGDFAVRDLVMAPSADGLEYRDPAAAGVRIQFSLTRPESVATSSAGAILAGAHGGRFASGYQDAPAAFGVMRPTRLMGFDRPATLAGFRYDRLRVRTADFAGRHALPAEAAAAGDIVVSRRVRPQPAVPIVLIGRDRLDRCSEIMFNTSTRRLALRCRFDAAPAR